MAMIRSGSPVISLMVLLWAFLTPLTAWSAPGLQIDVRAHGAIGDGKIDDTVAIQQAIDNAGVGNSIVFPRGTYKISTLTVGAGRYLYAPEGATIVGNMVARGPSTTIRGLIFAGGRVDISGASGITIGNCIFNMSTASIKLDNSSNVLIINNDFNDNSAVGSIAGWALDHATISGNHFVNCLQCISLDFTNDRKRGHNIVIERNIFIGTRRMPLEVGPIGAYTRDLVVRNNWAADFVNRGPDPGQKESTFVAYSVVPTYGVNSLIADNYADAGAHGRGRIGIELNGSGTVTGNYTEAFDFGAIVYGMGFDVHDNNFVDTRDAVVLNYAKEPGIIATNSANPAKTPFPRPARVSWP
jgi:hypothetical protein